MKEDNAMHYWAHMLDEALEKPIGDVKPDFYLPKDEHEKFNLNLMFPGNDFQTLPVEDITARIEQVWPDFWDYVIEIACRDTTIEVERYGGEPDDFYEVDIRCEIEKLFKDQNYIDNLYSQLIDDSKLFKTPKVSLEDVAHFIAGCICNDLEDKFNGSSYI